MGRKPKFSKEEKIEACEDYKKGNSSFGGIAAEIGAKKETVRQWYLKYKEHGANAFDTTSKNQKKIFYQEILLLLLQMKNGLQM